MAWYRNAICWLYLIHLTFFRHDYSLSAAYFNRLSPTLRHIRNEEGRSQQLRQLIAGGSSHEIASLQQRNENKRIRRKRKGKEDKGPSSSLHDTATSEFLEPPKFRQRIADAGDGQSICSEDENIIDVDLLNPAELRYELRRREVDTSGATDDIRERPREIIEEEKKRRMKKMSTWFKKSRVIMKMTARVA